MWKGHVRTPLSVITENQEINANWHNRKQMFHKHKCNYNGYNCKKKATCNVSGQADNNVVNGEDFEQEIAPY